MTKMWMGVVLGALLGCSSDRPRCAIVALEKTLVDSPLVRTSDLALMRAGDGFILAGYDNGTVRWGRVSLDGTVSEEVGFSVPQPRTRPVFAAAKSAVPGDQVIAVLATDSATAVGTYDLVAIAQTAGSSSTAQPVVLERLPVGIDLSTVQVTAGAAVSGNVGFAAWGIRAPGRTPVHVLLSTDGRPSEPAKMFDDSEPAKVPLFDCLATTGGTSGLGYSVTTTPAENSDATRWHTNEMDEAGGVFGMTYSLSTPIDSCRITGSPAGQGAYFMAFQSDNGIGFATYYPAATPGHPGSVTTHRIAISAADFGGPLHIPGPAWVSPAGFDLSIGLAGHAHPEVVRFNYNNMPQGSALPLRSELGDTGPVSAWVGPDAVYVTYSDALPGAAAPATARYFMRIESPATLP